MFAPAKSRTYFSATKYEPEPQPSGSALAGPEPSRAGIGTTYLRVRRVAEVPVVVTIIGTCRQREEIDGPINKVMGCNHYPPAQALVTSVRSSGFWPTGTRSSRNLCASFLLVGNEKKSVRMGIRRASHHDLVRGQIILT